MENRKRRGSCSSDSSSFGNLEERFLEFLKSFKKRRTARRLSRSRSPRSRSSRGSRSRSSRKSKSSRHSSRDRSSSNSSFSSRRDSASASPPPQKHPNVTVVRDKNDEQSNVAAKSSEPSTSRDEVLKKLGKDVLEEKRYSSAVNDLITRRWTGIVKKGLPEQECSEIAKLYPTPENNTLWDPPKLNPEFKTSIQESAVVRDNRIVAKQIKLSACLAANAQMIEELMKLEPSDHHNTLLGRLGDVGSILADLQHDESCIRKSLIVANTPSTSLKKVLVDTDIDEFLFGEKLDETIKSAKILAATSDELRQPPAKNSSKQSKNSKGPPRRSKNFQKASSGGQHYYNRSSHNRSSYNRRGSPHRSPRKENYKKDQQQHPRRQRK